MCASFADFAQEVVLVQYVNEGGDDLVDLSDTKRGAEPL